MRASVWIATVVLGALGAAAQRGPEATAKPFVGVWSGSWEGAGGSGGFELTVEEAKDGAVTGRVSVTGEPTYTAKLKTLSFDGTKMTAAYDFPPDEAGEVVLAATFEAKRADGTWLLREKAGGTEVARGTWTVSRK